MKSDRSATIEQLLDPHNKCDIKLNPSKETKKRKLKLIEANQSTWNTLLEPPQHSKLLSNIRQTQVYYHQSFMEQYKRSSGDKPVLSHVHKPGSILSPNIHINATFLGGFRVVVQPSVFIHETNTGSCKFAIDSSKVLISVASPPFLPYKSPTHPGGKYFLSQWCNKKTRVGRRETKYSFKDDNSIKSFEKHIYQLAKLYFHATDQSGCQVCVVPYVGAGAYLRALTSKDQKKAKKIIYQQWQNAAQEHHFTHLTDIIFTYTNGDHAYSKFEKHSQATLHYARDTDVRKIVNELNEKLPGIKIGVTAASGVQGLGGDYLNPRVSTQEESVYRMRNNMAGPLLEDGLFTVEEYSVDIGEPAITVAGLLTQTEDTKETFLSQLSYRKECDDLFRSHNVNSFVFATCKKDKSTDFECAWEIKFATPKLAQQFKNFIAPQKKSKIKLTGNTQRTLLLKKQDFHKLPPLSIEKFSWCYERIRRNFMPKLTAVSYSSNVWTLTFENNDAATKFFNAYFYNHVNFSQVGGGNQILFADENLKSSQVIRNPQAFKEKLETYANQFHQLKTLIENFDNKGSSKQMPLSSQDTVEQNESKQQEESKLSTSNKRVPQRDQRSVPVANKLPQDFLEHFNITTVSYSQSTGIYTLDFGSMRNASDELTKFYLGYRHLNVLSLDSGSNHFAVNIHKSDIAKLNKTKQGKYINFIPLKKNLALQLKSIAAHKRQITFNFRKSSQANDFYNLLNHIDGVEKIEGSDCSVGVPRQSCLQLKFILASLFKYQAQNLPGLDFITGGTLFGNQYSPEKLEIHYQENNHIASVHFTPSDQGKTPALLEGLPLSQAASETDRTTRKFFSFNAVKTSPAEGKPFYELDLKKFENLTTVYLNFTPEPDPEPSTPSSPRNPHANVNFETTAATSTNSRKVSSDSTLPDKSGHDEEGETKSISSNEVNNPSINPTPTPEAKQTPRSNQSGRSTPDIVMPAVGGVSFKASAPPMPNPLGQEEFKETKNDQKSHRSSEDEFKSKTPPPRITDRPAQEFSGPAKMSMLKKFFFCFACCRRPSLPIESNHSAAKRSAQKAFTDTKQKQVEKNKDPLNEDLIKIGNQLLSSFLQLYRTKLTKEWYIRKAYFKDKNASNIQVKEIAEHALGLHKGYSGKRTRKLLKTHGIFVSKKAYRKNKVKEINRIKNEINNEFAPKK